MVKKTKEIEKEEVVSETIESPVDADDESLYEMVCTGRDELGIKVWGRQKKSN